MTLHSDVLVVGGGIAGVSAAARIAEHASVTVLERESALGYHSTGRSAALFFLNYGNNVIRALNAASQPVFENPSEFSGEPWLSPRGALTLARPGQEAMLDEHMALAPGAKALSPETACELVPTLRPETLAAA
ncbi:MAG: FAD-dependent oxidoreductase, partial [Pseudomonadota bacterium]